MRTPLAVTMVMGTALGTTLGAGLGTAVAALAADVPAQSKITAVVVFPSGAEVTRTAKVKFEPGEHTLVFADLPAQAIASSIRVEGRSSGKLEIGSVDTKRASVARADAANAATERRRIETEIEKFRDQRNVFEGQKQAAESQKALIQNLTQLPVRPPPMLGQSGSGENWPQILALIATSSAEAQRALLEATVNLREVDRKIKDLEAKLGGVAPQMDERTEVKVHVAAGQPLEADFVVRYQVSSANWSALYDARLSTGTKAVAPKLELVRRASVTQRSGEAWTDVAIALSTTRPTSAAAAPELNPVTIDFEPEFKPKPVASPAPAARRDMMGGLAGAPIAESSVDAMADGDLPRARTMAKAVAAQEVRAEVVNAPFQAIFNVPGKLTIAETGEAKRVQLTSDSLDPALSIRAVPKRDQKAYLYAKLVLPKGAPILAGPVSLFRDGTFVGTGRLPLLSPAEEHELGFGADDLVRVKYAVADEKKGETGIISSSKTDSRNYKITLKSQHERSMAYTVVDQLPVSQQQEIRVDLVARPQPTRQNLDDKRGVLSWEGKIEPDEEKVIEHGYRITWPGARSIITR
ncbi:MAG: mucoidy inhibitor MuiA family protein [Hyphomicrobium sp.]